MNGILAATVSTPNVSSSAWVAFLIGVVIGMIITLFIKR